MTEGARGGITGRPAIAAGPRVQRDHRQELGRDCSGSLFDQTMGHPDVSRLPEGERGDLTLSRGPAFGAA